MAILDKPTVKRDLACGAVSVPDHKLVPDVRLILNRGRSGVIDRAYALLEKSKGDDALYDAAQRGVAIYPLGLAVNRYGIADPNDSPLVQVHYAGFVKIAFTQYYAAYASC